MANDRLYLRCIGCGNAIAIAANFGDPWRCYDVDVDRPLAPALDAFFDQHAACAHYYPEAEWPGSFTLDREQAPGFEEREAARQCTRCAAPVALVSSTTDTHFACTLCGARH